VEKDKKQNLSVFKAIRRTTPMVVKAAPFSWVIYALLAILHGSAWGFVAPVNQRLYDALANLAMGDGVLRYVYIGAAMVTALMLLQQVMNAVHNFFINSVLFEKVNGRLAIVLHKKLKQMPAQIYEDKNHLDDLEKGVEGRGGSINMYCTLSDAVFFYGAYFAVMGTFLWQMQPVLLFAFALVFTPVLLSQIVEAKYHAELERVSAPIRRQNAHYEDCLVGLKPMRETRLFGAYFFFKKLFMDSLELLAQKEWTTHKKIAAITLGLNIVKGAGWIGVLVLLFRSLMQGYITVGAFAAVFASVGMMFALVEEVVNRIKWSVAQNLGKIHNFINILDIPIPKKEYAEPDFTQGITLTDVTFAYSGADKNAVDGVSLSIRPGQTLALVGENGSGKTTLVKLLCGLYKPDNGRVLIGGQDVATTMDAALFAKTSGVFQNYGQYVFNLEENVRISSTEATHDPTQAMTDADVEYTDEKTFPKGLETILSREFEGVELSGGQWQRIATARGLYRNHDFIVLDEPTAAIDPVEETRMYKRFAELTRNKMAVLVTHRLGSVRIADKIAVMDGGKIVETGTHESLLAGSGKYAQMWAAQAGSYE